MIFAPQLYDQQNLKICALTCSKPEKIKLF